MADKKRVDSRDIFEKALDDEEYNKALGGAEGRVVGGLVGGLLVKRLRKGLVRQNDTFEKLLPAVGATGGALQGIGDIRIAAKNRQEKMNSAKRRK